MEDLFQHNKSSISNHIKIFFNTEDLDTDVVVAFFATTTQHTNIQGEEQKYIIVLYNLDTIILGGHHVY